MEVVAKLPINEQQGGELKLLLKALEAYRRGDSGVTLPTDSPTDLELPTDLDLPTDFPTDFDLPELPELPGGNP